MVFHGELKVGEIKHFKYSTELISSLFGKVLGINKRKEEYICMYTSM